MTQKQQQKQYETPWTEAEACEWLDEQRIATLPPCPFNLGYSTINLPTRRTGNLSVSVCQAFYTTIAGVYPAGWSFSIETKTYKKAQKRLCIGGPLDGTFEVIDLAPKEYVLFNSSGSYRTEDNAHKSILVHNTLL